MSMGKLMTGRLVRGINPEGVFDWLEYVRVYWSNIGVDLGFTWKAVKVRGGFVRNMVPGVINKHCWRRLCGRTLCIVIC
jgi:hypothetical protein